MATLSCITNLMEPGNFGSDIGEVTRPTGNVKFPITAYATFAASGVATVAFVGAAEYPGLFTEAGAATAAFVGASYAEGTFASAGVATAEFVGEGGEDGGDDELLLLLL